MDIVDAIMIAEDYDSTEKDKLEAISIIAKSGIGQSLQGSWGRVIANLKKHDLLTEDNEVNWDTYNEIIGYEDQD